MADFRPFSPCWGDISFTEAPRTTARCYAGAIFLSRSPFGATARARGVAWLRCPRVAGPGRTTRRRTEPHASTPGPTGMEGAGGSGGPGCGARGRRQGQAGLQGNAPATHEHTRRRRCGGRQRDLPRCRWAVAGPGRASRRRAERSSQRGRLAGGPPPTGTHSGRARRHPEHQRRNTPLRHNKTAQPHRGRAAQTISERGSAQDHDDVRITETAFLTDARNAKL